MNSAALLIAILGFVYLQFVASGASNHCQLIQCGNRRAPVCGEDGRTYRSMCHFIKTLCRRKELAHLRVKRRGFCRRSFVCSLPKAQGKCHRNYKRYYFDRHRKRCLPFRYGGCLGNRNNFLSYTKCKRYCWKYANIEEESTRRILGNVFRHDDIEDYDDRTGDEAERQEDEGGSRFERGSEERNDELEDEQTEEDDPVDDEEDEDDEGRDEDNGSYVSNEDEDTTFENGKAYLYTVKNGKDAANQVLEKN